MGAGAVARRKCANHGWRYLRRVFPAKICAAETAFCGPDRPPEIAAGGFEEGAGDQRPCLPELVVSAYRWIERSVARWRLRRLRRDSETSRNGAPDPATSSKRAQRR